MNSHSGKLRMKLFHYNFLFFNFLIVEKSINNHQITRQKKTFIRFAECFFFYLLKFQIYVL